jgi:hypothetical protein
MIKHIIIVALIVTNGVPHVLSGGVLIGVQDGSGGEIVDDPVVVILVFDRSFEVIDVFGSEIGLTDDFTESFFSHGNLFAKK